MTSKIIYHNFQNTDVPASQKAPGIVRAATHINTALNTTCIFLCGTCVGISILALVALWLG